MAIVKIILESDLGAGLEVVANKLVPKVDGTSVQLNGLNELSTVIDPGVINDLVTLSGLAAGSTDLGTFTGTIVPDSQTVVQAIQALETAIESINISGEYVGSSATFAALPATNFDGQAINTGDWAILNTDDGVNQAGIYSYNGAAYTLAKEIPEVFALVVETADSNSIALTGDGNTGTELTANLIVDAVTAENYLTVNANGALVDPVTVKADLVFDNELQDLAGNTLGYFSSTTTFA